MSSSRRSGAIAVVSGTKSGPRMLGSDGRPLPPWEAISLANEVIRAALEACEGDGLACHERGAEPTTVVADGQMRLQFGDETEKAPEDETDRVITAVIDHLNERARTKYRPSTERYRKLVRGRLSDGYSQDDILAVIDKKCDEWIGTEFAKYLRPDTLFSSGHFDAYLNEPSKGSGGHRNAEYDTV